MQKPIAALALGLSLALAGCGSDFELAPPAPAQAQTAQPAPSQRLVLLGDFQDMPGTALELHLHHMGGTDIEDNAVGRAWTIDRNANQIQRYDAYGFLDDRRLNLKLVNARTKQRELLLTGASSKGVYTARLGGDPPQADRVVKLSTLPQRVAGKYALGQGVLAGGTDVFEVEGDSAGRTSFNFNFTSSDGQGGIIGTWSGDYLTPPADGYQVVENVARIDLLQGTPNWATLLSNYAIEDGDQRESISGLQLEGDFEFDDLDTAPAPMSDADLGAVGLDPTSPTAFGNAVITLTSTSADPR